MERQKKILFCLVARESTLRQERETTEGLGEPNGQAGAETTQHAVTQIAELLDQSTTPSRSCKIPDDSSIASSITTATAMKKELVLTTIVETEALVTGATDREQIMLQPRVL